MINVLNTRRSTLALALAAVTLAGAAPVAAQSDDTVSVSVRYGDLDISRPAGAATMLRRIDNAAIQVCGGRPDQRVLDQRATFEKCRAATVDRSVAALGAPMVTAAAGLPNRMVAMSGR